MTLLSSTITSVGPHPEVKPAAPSAARSLRRRARGAVAALAAIILLGSLTALPASAEPAGGPNHVVTAIASTGNNDVTRSGLQVASVGAPSVTSENIARAVSHDCTGCRAAAAAFQAVFATGNPNTVTPENVATAVNVNCTGCDTFAFAYQYVLTTNGPVTLSGAERQDLAGMRQQIAGIVGSGAPDFEIDSRLRILAAQFKSIIDQNLRRAGIPGSGSVHEHVESAPSGS